MENKNLFAAKRFKQIREELGLSQREFAEKLNIKNNIADLERNRTRISGYTLAQLMQHFNINPLWLYGIQNIKRVSDLQTPINPKVITLNSEANENMVLVDAKAAAGYPTNVQDPFWFNSLPAFDFPLPEYRNATYRGFQVQGNSMYPNLRTNEWVIGKALETLEEVKDNRIYVVVLKDSVLVKQVAKNNDQDALSLLSINPEFAPISIQKTAIIEVWEVTSKLSFDINTIGETASIHDLQLAINRLTAEVKQWQPTT